MKLDRFIEAITSVRLMAAAVFGVIVTTVTVTIGAVPYAGTPKRVQSLESFADSLRSLNIPAFQRDASIQLRFNTCVSIETINHRDPRGCMYWIRDPTTFLPPEGP